MDPVKANLTHIQKLVIVAAVACRYNHAIRRIPDRGWRVIANDMNVSERTIKRVWNQYVHDINHHVAHEDIVKPRKKQRLDYQSQYDQETMTAIDEAILNKDGFITYRE